MPGTERRLTAALLLLLPLGCRALWTRQLLPAEEDAGDVVDGNVTVPAELRPCNGMVRPLSDFDTRLGHGNPECRYEPLESEAAARFDIAIAMPHDHLADPLPEDASDLRGIANRSAFIWRAYARRHGYAFYAGPPETACAGAETRASAWLKPCAARQLLQRHAYVLLLDADTLVLKPRLRLEPLFARLLQGQKAIAAAEEWGSCSEGRRHPPAGGHNTGVLLLKRTDRALEALQAWYARPAECLAELQRRGQTVADVAASADPDECAQLALSLSMWSYDQLAFEVAVSRKFPEVVATLQPGCPVNSPWGDFVAHLVKGTPSARHYWPGDREAIFRSAVECVGSLLLTAGPSADPRARCGLCGLLGAEASDGAWELACPSA